MKHEDRLLISKFNCSKNIQQGRYGHVIICINITHKKGKTKGRNLK